MQLKKELKFLIQIDWRALNPTGPGLILGSFCPRKIVNGHNDL